MKIPSSIRPLAVGIALLTLGGAAFALQQGRSRPGEVRAESSLELPGDVEVRIAYSTIAYGAATFEAIKSRPDVAARWASMLPNVLGGEFETDAQLRFGEVVVPEGEYRMTFGLKEGGGFEWVLLSGDEVKARVPLTGVEVNLDQPFLQFALTSVGSDSVRLSFSYGKEAGYADATVEREKD